MPSTYTTNGGIELPANGEQSGTWGETVNDNMAIIDRLTNGVGAISLSGTTHTLTTADGTLSDGQYNVLVLGGSPSGTNTITISPNDGEHVYVVKNASGQTATFTQGSGANVSVLNNTTKIIYADGAGAGAAVVDITGALDLGSLIIAGTSVTATAAELNFVDGVTSNVQTQLNTKAPLASPTFTGTATVSGNLSVDGGTIKLDGNYPVGTGNVALGDTALDNPILLNRLSTDGDIILMQKDGTTVGSIGAAAGGININSQGGDFAIRRSGGDVLYVGTTATYPATDNGKDLGVSSYRWKDLYLSGGVVFNVAGGTGTSTSGTLDDYEEGTWTAAVSGGTTVLTNVTGYYTKIGNVVTFSYYTGTSDLSSASGGMTITGLPFAASNGTSFNTAVNIAHNTFFGGSATEGQDAYVGTNGTTIYMVTTGTTTTSTFTDGTGKFLMISGTYYTSS
jgi:hypothetical protein